MLDRVTYEKNGFGSNNHHIDIALTKFLGTESYIADQLIKTYNTPKLLIEVINNYNDLEAIDNEFDYGLFNNLEKDIDSKSKELFKKNLNQMIDDFIKDKNAYILWVGTVLEHTDYDRIEVFNKYLKKEQKLEFTEKIMEGVKKPLFKKYIINPLLDYIAYFDDSELCLRFIKKIDPMYRNKHILSLYVNKLMNNYCVFDKSRNLLVYKENTDLLVSANKTKKKFLDFIVFVYNKLQDKEYFNLKELKTYLESKGGLKSIDKTVFPFTMLHKKHEINTNFLLGLIQGIFILKPNQLKRKDNSGKIRKVYVFQDNTSIYPNNKILKRNRYDKKTNTSKVDTYIRSSFDSINSKI